MEISDSRHNVLLLTIFLNVLISTAISPSDCRGPWPATCGVNETLIRDPFRLQNQHRSCGQFELFCKQNKTILRLPNSIELHVTEIDYQTRRLLVSALDGCLHRQLLQLNLSSSPFYMPEETLRKSTYLNCSEDLADPNGYAYVPCLSGHGSRIYVVNSSRSMASLPPYCESLGTVSISTDSYRYFPILRVYVYSNSSEEDRLYLTWSSALPGRNNSKDKLLIIGLSIGGGCIVVVTMVLYYRIGRIPRNQNKIGREERKRVEKMLEDYGNLMLARYSYPSIKRMTHNFKRKIGSGGYGCVYGGNLSNGIPVAIKILHNSKSNSQDFINEIATIGRVHHFNVVRLLGFCCEGSKRALIYEFMPNHSLEKFLHYKDTQMCSREWLGWRKMEQIAIGIANGIDYLHSGCTQRILHLDIKPHNILLDHDFHPKISDFGLARICSNGQSKVDFSSNRGGTVGYIAPEIVSRTFGVVSHKSDVYSFGMLLLEMTGRRKKKIDSCVEDNEEETSFLGRASHDDLYEIEMEEIDIDVEMKAMGEDESIVRKLTVVAQWCVQWNPNDRPSMKVVIKMLQEEVGSLQWPPRNRYPL